MKKHLLLFLYCLLISVSYSQVNIGKSKSPINLYVSDLKQAEFDSVKNSPTYFVVPNQFDYENFKQVIGEVWTLNKLSFISEKEYKDNKKSFFATGNTVIALVDKNYQKIKENISTGASHTTAEYVSFKFRVNHFLSVEKNKKGKLKIDFFNVAEVFFTASIKYRSDLIASSSRQSVLMLGKTFGKEKAIDKSGIKEPDFYNFNLGYIKNYFQIVNDKLEKNINFKIEDGFVDKIKIKSLKNQTLYAPDWFLRKYNPLNGDLKKIIEPDEIFNTYQSEYKIISNKELNDKILAGDEFYYLNYTQFNQTKVISIINSLSGEIIYLKEDGSYNIKDSDLKSINKLVN